MDNPYEWLVESYAKNMPPREHEAYEEWRKNLNTALLQSIAWGQGYKAGVSSPPNPQDMATAMTSSEPSLSLVNNED